MAIATTAFVTDPIGLVGAELVSTLVAHGHDVVALAADWVCHLPPAVDDRRLGREPIDTVLSNVGLRRTGFEFEYPTVEQGCRQILRTLHD